VLPDWSAPVVTPSGAVRPTCIHRVVALTTVVLELQGRKQPNPLPYNNFGAMVGETGLEPATPGPPD
jgi:hypothetical protein